jgi:hypothetical protein
MRFSRVLLLSLLALSSLDYAKAASANGLSLGEAYGISFQMPSGWEISSADGSYSEGFIRYVCDNGSSILIMWSESLRDADPPSVLNAVALEILTNERLERLGDAKEKPVQKSLVKAISNQSSSSSRGVAIFIIDQTSVSDDFLSAKRTAFFTSRVTRRGFIIRQSNVRQSNNKQGDGRGDSERFAALDEILLSWSDAPNEDYIAELEDGGRNRPKTGTMIRDGGREGLGMLELDNPMRNDSVAILAFINNTVLCAVYVRSNDSFVLDGVPDATYFLYFTSGRGWDFKAGSFSRDAVYGYPERPIIFSTMYLPEGIKYKTISVMLGSNMRSISNLQFPSLA